MRGRRPVMFFSKHEPSNDESPHNNPDTSPHRLPAELTRLKTLEAKFDQHLLSMKQELRENLGAELAGPLSAKLDVAESMADEIMVQVERVLTSIDQNRADLAAPQVAAANRMLAR